MGKLIETDGPREKHAEETWTAAVGKAYPVPTTGLVVRWEKIRDPRGGAKYLSKYASKVVQKTVPDHIYQPGRWWGASRGVKRLVVARIPMDDSRLAACFGGAEKAWNGETYRLLHGGTARLEAVEAGCGLGGAIEDAARIMLGHAQECQCLPCIRRRGDFTFGCYLPETDIPVASHETLCMRQAKQGRERARWCILGAYRPGIPL